MVTTIPERLSLLREQMKKAGIAAYLIPSTDAHQSEYVPECWQRRPWISGFTGSAGDVVVTIDEAGLWADSRYYLQAEDQLSGSGITLFKSGLPGVPKMEEWLVKILDAGDAVGVDPRVIGIRQSDSLAKELAEVVQREQTSQNGYDRQTAGRVPDRHAPEQSGRKAAGRSEAANEHASW